VGKARMKALVGRGGEKKGSRKEDWGGGRRKVSTTSKRDVLRRIAIVGYSPLEPPVKGAYIERRKEGTISGTGFSGGGKREHRHLLSTSRSIWLGHNNGLDVQDEEEGDGKRKKTGIFSWEPKTHLGGST